MQIAPFSYGEEITSLPLLIRPQFNEIRAPPYDLQNRFSTRAQLESTHLENLPSFITSPNIVCPGGQARVCVEVKLAGV